MRHGKLKGLVCLGSWGDVHWVCPLIEQYEGPPFLELESMAWQDYVDNISYKPCFYCPEQDPLYGQDCQSSVENMTQIFNMEAGSATLMLERCVEMCESGLTGDACSDNEPCTMASHFCDFSADGGDFGVCQVCPTSMDACYDDGFLSSEKGRRDCSRCQQFCYDLGHAKMVVGGEEIPSDFLHFAIQDSFLFGSGPIVDCSNLVINEEQKCDGAKGSVCYVDDFTSQVLYWQLSDKAEANGCNAIVFTAPYQDVWLGCGTHGFSDIEIPFVCIHPRDGKNIKDSFIGINSSVEVEVTGQACLNYHEWGDQCSELVSCSEGEFCPFDKQVVDSEYVIGYCRPCPVDEDGNPDPLYCYFDTEGGNIRNAKLAANCVESCNAQIQYKSCKFCPEHLDPIRFGVVDKADKCSFCPNHDVRYPQRLVPLFGDNISCWQMQGFYENMDISKDSQNCILAQSMNFICGCEGTGYAGAQTKAKAAALAWLPRLMAILSTLLNRRVRFVLKYIGFNRDFQGSSFILCDTTKTRQKRGKMLNQMLATLSVFDILGSIAYAFTTLPTPESDYIYGSRGNYSTCVAQGFFIQIGTIACFLNTSIAVYYLMSIKHGWNDDRMKAKRLWLFVPPIIVGLVYWPESPVIFSIATATFVMGDVCQHVYKNTRATRRYSASRGRISKTVFMQACWFTGAFYITWIPYVALQYMWSSGRALTNYGFILYAATSVPLQGFWNFVVYIRPRYIKGAVQMVPNFPRAVTSRVSIVPRRSAVVIASQVGVLDSIIEEETTSSGGQ
ncbi:LOW QUALITY PROTEIN: hypothetical protein HJC23_007303 [Cyclotella cryptica]|uniref:Uncharacterized protein n=1 Tax=Cyclotella cryptica TaxID=29204 RepID=A0ABD3P2T4_9STRA